MRANGTVSGTGRTREGETKGDNTQEGPRGEGEDTEGQWGGEESRGSEGGNGLRSPPDSPRSETSRVKWTKAKLPRRGC